MSVRTQTLSLFCLALSLLLLAAPAAAGSITGKVTYDDKVPNLKPLDMNADPACAAKHSSPVMPQVLEIGDGNGLAWVFVQVIGASSNKPAPTTPVVIDQNGCQYDPHVAGVLAGQKLVFKNSDGILHNVHLLPKKNRELNIGMPPTLKEKETTFTTPEEVFPVKCDVHPWMRAYVAVMEHPFFATTGRNGAFEIKDLPAGTYDVVAWHEKLGTMTQKVTVGASGAATANFSFKVPSK